MATLKDNLLDIPPVTRFFTIVTLATALLRGLGFFRDAYEYSPRSFWDEMYFVSDAEDFFDMLWRATCLIQGAYRYFTTFFFAAGEDAFVFLKIYSFYLFSSKLESRAGKFRGNFPDYLWFIIFCGLLFIVLETVIFFIADHYEAFLMYKQYIGPAYHRKLFASICFVWLRHLKSSIVGFMGILSIRSYYLPLFDLAFAIVESKESVWDALMGFFVAYLYLCIQSDTLPFYNLVPRVYGKDDPRLTSRQRVGVNSTVHDEFLPAIFDLGYWKAPRFIYWLVGYPLNSSVRSTAFKQPPKLTVKVNRGFRSSILNEEPQNTFKGTGHRLGGPSDKKKN